MAPAKLHLNDDQTFVEGRGTEKAKELLALAKPHGLEREISATSIGYIVPSIILEGADKQNEQTPAVVPVTAENQANADQGTPDPADGEKSSEASTEGNSGEQTGEQFDPDAHTVKEVLDYLTSADETERERVLAAEAEGQARKTILPDTEGAK